MRQHLAGVKKPVACSVLSQHMGNQDRIFVGNGHRKHTGNDNSVLLGREATVGRVETDQTYTDVIFQHPGITTSAYGQWVNATSFVQYQWDS